MGRTLINKKGGKGGRKLPPVLNMAAGAIAVAIAKWAAGIGATAITTNLLNDYYQKNKGKIGKTFGNWVSELGKMWQENYEKDIGSARVELLDQPKNENTSVTQSIGDKEQTNGLQGSMDYTEFNKWLKSEEGQRFLNESKAEDFEFTEDQTIGEMLPNPGEEKYDDKTGQGFDTPSEPGEEIVDKTDENTGTNVIDWISWAEEQQKKQWEREDAIRKETQEREDNAYQRAVTDMRKAGINPNLMNVSPAQSGGGITQATGQNIAGATSQMNIDLEEMQQLLDQAFKGDENDKDRFADLLGKVLNFVTIVAMMKK